MTRQTAKYIRIAMGVAVMTGYIGGVALGIMFNTWWVLLGSPLFLLTAPDPYKYFGKEAN